MAVESGLLMDYENLLTAQEQDNLMREMERISAKMGYSVGFVSYSMGSQHDSWHAENGEDYIILAVNMNSRRMDLNVGGTAFYAMDDYEKDRILDVVAPQFSVDNYGEGISYFLSMTESVITGVTTEAENARLKEEKLEESIPLMLLSVGISFLVAGGITFSFVKSMNNVREQKNARQYQGKRYITKDQEIFLYRNVTSIRRQENTGRSSGGGGGGRGSFSSGSSRGF